MSDAPPTRNEARTDERAIADGGSATASPLERGTVVDRTPEQPVIDFPPLGATDDGDHPFYPVELSREALALPVLASLAVAIGAQGTAFLGAGGTLAVVGSVAFPLVAVAAVFLAHLFL